jgi:acyl-CoA thioester hydrolase
MSAAPTSGTLTGKTHVLPVRVYYEDTDAGGIVYHANYLRFAERARTEMLRLVGIHQNQLREREGLVFAAYKGDVHYLKPARLDDVLRVETNLTELSGALLCVRQIIKRRGPNADEELVRFNAQIVCMTEQGKAARVPASLRKILEPFVVSSDAA